MLKIKNYSWCEKIIMLLLCVISSILLLDYKYAVLPLHGIYIIAYLFLIIIISTWITFIYLQKILQNNKPYEYDFDRNIPFKFIAYIYTLIYYRKPKQKSVLKTSSTVTENHIVNEPSGDCANKPSVISERCVKNIDERIDILVKDIQIRFILKWYLHISSDASFLSESKILIDDVIRRFLQVVIDINSRKLAHGCSIIFLRHIKEFRKTLKRCQKTNAPVEELYRYSHLGCKSKKAAEYFLFQLTSNIFRQFINWELWNSLPCQSLVSILSKKFTTYLLAFISTPGYLNYKIIGAFGSPTVKAKLKLDNYYYISLSDVDHSGRLTQLNNVHTPIKTKNVESLINEESNTPKLSPRKSVKVDTDSSKHVDEIDCTVSIAESAILHLNNDEAITDDELVLNPDVDDTKKTSEKQHIPKASEPVKIYESKTASNKTWRNSSDLECISLGQDLLAFQEFNDPDTQIQQLIEKKLWKDNTDAIDEEKTVWDIPEPVYEEQEAHQEAHEPTNETTLSPTTNFQNYLKSTANNAFKPIGDATATTLHNMKELQQTTVHNVMKPVSQATTNAMHKIGDLQDEAAGMVEGIFDFGMAGLRKGLRLTGLQENITELTQKAKNEFHDLHKTIDMQMPIATGKISEAIKIMDNDINKQKMSAKLIKTPRVTSEEKTEHLQSSSESDESVWINPLTKDSPSFDGDILLERTPDAPKSILPEQPRNLNFYQKIEDRGIPLITEDTLTGESPDPEYEDTQDLASTIAKLRSLLQQKSSESGFTTPSLSPMPQDEMIKTPIEPDFTKTDGAMPSLYKFCARTATGVFQNTLNTIKTALPGNTNDSSQVHVPCTNGEWTFVEGDSCNDDFNSRMKKLLSERQAYCTIDTAYEAIHSLEVADQVDLPSPVTNFEDELDEFDLHVPITKVLVDIVCELVGDTKICLLQETVVKALLLFIGGYSEEYITKQSDSLLHNINKFVGKLPENTNQDVLCLKLQEMVNICLDTFPGVAKNLLGDETLETGINLLINSLQSQRINQDIFMQVFELFTSELINACSQASPAYSA